jgi:hypothetical protein
METVGQFPFLDLSHVGELVAKAGDHIPDLSLCGHVVNDRRSGVIPEHWPSPVTSRPMRHITEISRWEVTLSEGSVIEVWADGYQEIDGVYSFGVLVDAEGEVGSGVLVTNWTPSDADRLVIALAQFPVSAVAEIRSA